MKSYFIRLWDYNRFANKQMLELLLKRPNENSESLMAHLLSAEQIWLMRCNRISTTGLNVWPNLNAGSFDAMINSNHAEWVSFLSELTEGGFVSSVKYQNQAGEPFENNMCDIIAHAINHGTHTRAQIGQQLKLGKNDKLPATDYIYYLRDFANQL